MSDPRLDGYRVNCLSCGRFVGRDGAKYAEWPEYGGGPPTSLDGECARCLADRLARAVEGEEDG